MCTPFKLDVLHLSQQMKTNLPVTCSNARVPAGCVHFHLQDNDNMTMSTATATTERT